MTCLQETRFGAQDRRASKGFSIFSKLRQNLGHHGVAMLVHNSRPHYPFTLQTNLQAVAVHVQLKRKYTICSLHLSPSENIQDNDIIELFDQLPEPFLVLGDFNARHSIWGDSERNNNGAMMERLLPRLNVSVLNLNKPMHYHIQTDTFTHVDLSICSPDAYNDFTWDVEDCFHTSDRYPILLTLNNFTLYMHVSIFNHNKANWNDFKAIIDFNRDILTFNNIDIIIEHFNDRVIRAAEHPFQEREENFI